MRLVLASAAWPPDLSAQEQRPAPGSQPAPSTSSPAGFRAGTDMVRVDVTVTAARDEPVADLTTADFEVTEDEVPQEVETSKFIQRRRRAAVEPRRAAGDPIAGARALEAARDDVRLFAIFLDDYHIDKRPDITLPLRDALTKFVNQLGPNDLVALMDPLTTLYDLKYTRSKADLIAAFAPSKAAAARRFR